MAKIVVTWEEFVKAAIRDITEDTNVRLKELNTKEEAYYMPKLVHFDCLGERRQVYDTIDEVELEIIDTRWQD